MKEAITRNSSHEGPRCPVHALQPMKSQPPRRRPRPKPFSRFTRSAIVSGPDVFTPARAAHRVGSRAVPSRTSVSSAVAFDDGAVGAASRSSLAAENALMQAAMGAVRDGDDTRAAALFGDFLSRYPRSPLAQNAEVERFRCLERLGDERAAARLARRYLGEHPNGMAESEARRVGAPVSSPGPTARP